MQVDWGTVLVSTAVTLTTGAVAFVVATRVAKDQGDRELMRAIYRRLYGHFELVRGAVERGWPLSWSDFPLKASQYEPPVLAMKADGEIALLPTTLAASLERREESVLRAGAIYRTWVEDTYLPAAQQIVRERTAGRTESISMRRYCEIHLAHLPLLTQTSLSDLCNRVEQDNLGVGLETVVERGRTYLMHIYPEKIVDGGTIRRLLEDLAALAQADQTGVAAVAAVRSEERAVEAVLQVLAGRIRDPHPLWHSLRNALRDLRPNE